MYTFYMHHTAITRPVHKPTTSGVEQKLHTNHVVQGGNTLAGNVAQAHGISLEIIVMESLTLCKDAKTT
jgi:hypothetical protein